MSAEDAAETIRQYKGILAQQDARIAADQETIRRLEGTLATWDRAMQRLEGEVARLTRDRDAWVETSRLIQQRADECLAYELYTTVRQRAEAAEGAVKGLSEKVTQLYKSLEAAEAELAHWRREHDEKE